MTSGWSRQDLQVELGSSFRVDPYLIWAELSEWAGFGRPGKDDFVRVLFELPEPASAAQDKKGARLLRRSIRLNPLNGTMFPQLPFLYGTISLRRRHLPLMTWLVRKGYLVRFQLGLARGNSKDEVGTALLENILVPQALPSAVQRGETSNIFRTIGLIDDGCCVAHEAYRSGNLSRFLIVWDQRGVVTPGGPWSRYTSVAYGEEIGMAQLGQLLGAARLGCEEQELAFYREALDRDRWGRPDRSHGSGVLHMFTGTGTCDGTDASSSPRAPIIFVQLPGETAADTSGGSLGLYVIDGARYVVQLTGLVAELLGKPGPSKRPMEWHTTVNVSLGSTAGPHDGTTITERALAQLGSLPNVEIVLAAGNTAGQRVHATRVASAGSPARFDLLVPPDNPRESYVELWLPTDDISVLPDDFTVEVVAPDGSRSGAVAVGQLAALNDGNGVTAALVFPKAVAQGLNGTMVLLAVRATQDQLSSGGGMYGFWSVVLHTDAAHPVRVHTWIERNDVIIGARRPQQTFFIDDGTGYVSDDTTLSSIANGENVTVAGAFRRHEKEVSPYCAEGPTLGGGSRKGPDIYAPADESRLLPGLAVDGFFSGSRRRMSGTSIAAPHVARWIECGRVGGTSSIKQGQGAGGVEGVDLDGDACAAP